MNGDTTTPPAPTPAAPAPMPAGCTCTCTKCATDKNCAECAHEGGEMCDCDGCTCPMKMKTPDQPM